MLVDLEAGFSALKQRGDALVSRLAELEERALSFRRAEKQWNLLEVSDHLLRSEEASLGFVRKALTRVEPGSRPDFRSKWALPLMRFILGLPLRFRIPSSVRGALSPGTGLTIEALRERWSAGHEEWRELLEKIPSEMENAPLFRHPIAGSMKLADALSFLALHFDHHLRQIDRIITDPRFPDASGS